MTAANPIALVEVRPGRRRTATPTVDVAGVRWPAYKLHAVLLAVLVALFAFALTGSGAVVAWVSASVLLATWWGERIWLAHRD
ncbi:hypothetical protein GIY30_07240 [Gordonia sp. HNM0687]|uniref:Uncharacterized protein n=1 Tax=Gordonia mangrovi TaxID=2665643 RepID=A0A6L7GP42_9ACTN|nr:hypothetical protein [Gordonia mangrovi]MXP21147.1 hypothetical protein [Gordonia mangrovi]UVF78316.1 hypothetical protein NWF22_24450 [Gordonia mangrovi]